MPQMAPLMWMTLFFLFIFIFMIFNVLNYFNFLKFNKALNTDMKLSNKTYSQLTWKW